MTLLYIFGKTCDENYQLNTKIISKLILHVTQALDRLMWKKSNSLVDVDGTISIGY